MSQRHPLSSLPRLIPHQALLLGGREKNGMRQGGGGGGRGEGKGGGGTEVERREGREGSGEGRKGSGRERYR